MAPMILIFSIALGADYTFYMKTIETHARTFFKVIIFSTGSVKGVKNKVLFFVCNSANFGSTDKL